MQIETNPTVPPRATVRALRTLASAAEMVVLSPDGDPQVKAALSSLQAQFEQAAHDMETAMAAAA